MAMISMAVCRPFVALLVVCWAAAALGMEEDDSEGFSSFLQVQSEVVAQSNFSTPKTIRGQIKLNGHEYTTVCKCKDQAFANKCKPPRMLHVHQEPWNTKRGFSRDQLKTLLGRPRDIRMLSAAKRSFSCVDGRDTHVVLATPGGDFGEFVSALSVVEDMMGKNFTLADVKRILRHLVARKDGNFFYCTDDDAVDHLQKNLHVNGETGVVLGLDVTKPAKMYRPEILRDIVKPANQGDYFLKAMLSNADRFYTRVELVHHAIRALFQLVWNKKAMDPNGVPLAQKVKVTVYQGPPKEKAWINLVASKTCRSEGMAPGFAPKGRVLVNHPKAANVLRRKLARFLKTQVKLNQKTSVVEARIIRQAVRNMELFAGMRGMSVGPFYTVVLE